MMTARRDRTMRRLTAVLLAGWLLGAITAPAIAQEPSPEPPPWFGGRVEMPKHGFAVVLPDGAVAYDMTGDLESQLRVVAPDASGEDVAAWSRVMRERMPGQLVISVGDSTCGLVVGPTIGADLAIEMDAFHGRQAADESVVHVESPRLVELPAAEARLITYGRAGEEAAFYLGEKVGMVFDIWCVGAERPADDWLSVATTLEWLPVPVQRASTPRLGASFEVPAAWAVMTDIDFLPESPLSPSSELRPTDWLMARDAQTGEGCSLFTFSSDPSTPVALHAEVTDLLADYSADPDMHVLTPTPEPLSLPAGNARRIQVVSDEGRLPDGSTHIDAYVLAYDDVLIKVQCSGALPHHDRWRSIAETLELPPAEG